MDCDYADIIDRLGTPLWYDEVGCPRYCDFNPDRCASIYAREAALVRIGCQSCDRKFMVAFSSEGLHGGLISDAILDGVLHWGDPPRHQRHECCAGDTMNCFDLQVLQFWVRSNFDWVRFPWLEINLPDLTGEGEETE